MSMHEDIAVFGSLLQEGIEGVRRRRFFYAKEVMIDDGEDALSALPPNYVDELVGIVREWGSTMPPGRRGPYLAGLCTQFLKAVADPLVAHLEESLGVRCVVYIRSGGVRDLLSSRFRLWDTARDSLVRLYHRWVITPHLRRSFALTPKMATELCDDTVGFVRMVAAALVKFLSVHSKVGMRISVYYPYKEVEIDVTKTQAYRRMQQKGKVVGKRIRKALPRKTMIPLDRFPVVGADRLLAI